MNYREYQKNYQLPFKDEIFIAYIISCKVSYLINKIFYRDTLKPNYISFMMLIFGWVGGLLYSISNLGVQIVGYIFMHLWFIFDAWDGEVARQTKRFSKYGKEFDYLVHLLVHPVMLVALYFNAENTLCRNLILVYLVLNVIKRGLYLLHFSVNHVDSIDHKPEKAIYNDKNIFRDIVQFLLSFFASGPNIILIAPILIFFHLNTIIKLYTICSIIVTLYIIYSETNRNIRIYLKNA